MLCVSTVVNPQVTVIQAKACPKVVEVVSFWAAMACLPPPWHCRHRAG